MTVTLEKTPRPTVDSAGPPRPGGSPPAGRPHRRRDNARRRSAVPAVRPKAASLPRGQVIAVWLMVAISALAVFFGMSVTWFSGFQAHRANSLLYAQLRQGLSEETTPTGGAVAPGTPIAVLSIPAIGLQDRVIVEGSDSQQTSRAVGHRRDTVLPGQIGTSLLYGRSVMYGGVFADISALRPGQRLSVATAQGAFTYQVERVRRDGDPLPTPLATDGSRMILATAGGSPFSSMSTVFVDTKIVGKAVAGPSGRPSYVSAPEKALGTNSSSLVLLVLWLQALVLSGALATWAATRWGGRQVWIVATPVVIGTLWESVQQVLLLMPNLF